MIDLSDYGYNPDTTPCPKGMLPARIVEVQREQYRAVCEHGEISALLSGAFLNTASEQSDYPAIGDFVHLKYNEFGASQIVSVLPRTSKFSRTDFSGHAAGYVKTVLEQVVSANFDYVFIFTSLNLDFNVGRVARYLSAAYESGGVPVVILTKSDLCDDVASRVSAVQEIAPGVDVIPVSGATGDGLSALVKYIKPGKTCVFLGMSGVGKSTLLNALAGEEVMLTKEIREDDARGRHTTTYRRLVMLPSGAMLIDTPGMRELGLWNAVGGIMTAFSDVEALAETCKFADCRHETEPGCAIKAALEDGSLSAEKYKSYLAQQREAAFVENKAAYMQVKSNRQKAMSKRK